MTEEQAKNLKKGTLIENHEGCRAFFYEYDPWNLRVIVSLDGEHPIKGEGWYYLTAYPVVEIRERVDKHVFKHNGLTLCVIEDSILFPCVNEKVFIEGKEWLVEGVINFVEEGIIHYHLKEV